MPEPRDFDQDPLSPRDLEEPRNPRDPLGSGGSELNPTRDHVQGEPEGTTPDANEHEPPTPTTPPATEPPAERDPYYYDPARP
jgi:hypothetical protein